MDLQGLLKEKNIAQYNYMFYLQTLVQSTAAEFQISPQKDFLVKVNRILYRIDCYEELEILWEVFVRNEYQMGWNKAYVLIDVGMNVATTTLYFASQPNVVHVYGFEPFEKTFHKAKENINLNPSLQHKISPLNYALGRKARKETCSFNSDRKGGNSIYQNGMSLERERSASMEDERVEINVNNASAEFLKIQQKHPLHELVVKMDCEGAEYEIFEDLLQSGILLKIRAFLMEFHGGNEQRLIDLLKMHGYIVFTHFFSIETPKLGMLYAVRV